MTAARRGAIWVHRRLLDSAHWHGPDAYARCWLAVLLLADWRPGADAGSLTTSWIEIRHHLPHVSAQQWRHWLRWARARGSIETARVGRTRVRIAVLHYARYQRAPSATPTLAPRAPTTPTTPTTPAKRGRADTWLTPYGEAWLDRAGGPLPYARAARDLRPLDRAHGPDETLRRWRIYLAATPPAMLSSARFRATWAAWETTAASGGGRRRDVDQIGGNRVDDY